LIEAAACGRAVVTTDVPGCRDAIDPGKTGLLVPVRDPQALADAIARLAGDATQRQAMGAAGRALAEREFNIERVARIHVDLYDTLSA
ncbi:glycosyltransferase, partial [Achromobacter xylosoxidans]|nr:glycosyltransferase [Achromobacter xylosoxidans]